MTVDRITVLGDGGWGTAMARLLAATGRSVTLWGHDEGYIAEMRRTRRNRLFLPGVDLPAEMAFTSDIARALASCGMAIVAVPSKFLRPVLARAAGMLGPDVPVLSLTKGLDDDTLQRASQVVVECLGPRRVAALSGPSHAEEVARDLPASVVVASDDMDAARLFQAVVSTPRFRAYASSDLIGVEMAGTMKNVIALAAGIVHGMGLGDNALSALATRGLAEMTRLGVAMGGETSTFAGLAGMGDLITTCISPHGRNRRVGVLLAGGKRLDDILAEMNGVPESVTTTAGVLRLARRHAVEMPITREVAAVIWEGKRPEAALDDLMGRAMKDED